MSTETTEPDPTDGTSGDEAFVDDVFDRALSALERGDPVEQLDLLALPASTRARIEEALQLAAEVAPHVPRRLTPRPEIEGFQIEREIGSGAMGTVYLARQLALGGRDVALKVLSPALVISSRSKARFLAEACALARIDHPGVVGVHAVVDRPGILAYAMDWVQGGSLAGVIAAWQARSEGEDMEVLAERLGVSRATFGVSNAMTWILRSFASLARALAVVHEHGLVHRDIKPGNILVRATGQLVLSDFGLVRDSEAVQFTRTGQYVGTVAYSPPEQLRGDLDAVDGRSDVYGLGVTLYEALTLGLPYRGRTLAEIRQRAESGCYEKPCRRSVPLPRDVEAVLAKAIDPDPQRRYADASAFADDLDRLLGFRPVRARPVTRWSRLLKAIRRNRRAVGWSAAVGIAVIALTATTAAYLLLTPPEIAKRRAEMHVSLLGPARLDRMISYREELPPSRRFPLDENQIRNLERDVEACDEAIGLDPFGLFAESALLAREQDVVRLALAVARRSVDPELLARRSQIELQLTTSVARGWAVSGEREPVGADELQRALPADRDALGLLGFLLYDSPLAQQCWSERSVDAEPNALVDAALGEIYLAEGRHARALARLDSAMRIAPRSRFLCGEYADCLIRIGELVDADKYLRRETALEGEDAYENAARVRADWYVAKGDLEEARKRYADLLLRHSGERLEGNYARLLARLGDHATELHMRAAQICSRPHRPSLHRELLDTAEEWWCALGKRRRWEETLLILGGNLSAWPPIPKAQSDVGWLGLLRRARHEYRSLPPILANETPPPRSWSAAASAGRRPPVATSVVDIAERVARLPRLDRIDSRVSRSARSVIAALWSMPLREPLRSALPWAIASIVVRARAR
jgi:serine/threonine protein kinase